MLKNANDTYHCVTGVYSHYLIISSQEIGLAVPLYARGNQRRGQGVNEFLEESSSLLIKTVP